MVTQNRRVLVIPHAPATPIRTRSAELGRAMVALGSVVDVYHRNIQPSELGKVEKLYWHVREFFHGFDRLTLDANFSSIIPPALHSETRAARFFDSFVSTLLCRRYDLVFSAAYGGLKLKRGFGGRHQKLIYDLVDDHACGFRAAGYFEIADRVDEFVGCQIKTADIVTASSLVLVELTRQKFGRQAVLVPNGANIEAIRQAGKAENHTRRRADAEPIRIGYVGGLDEFVDIQLVSGAVEILNKRGIKARLVVVGDGPAVRGWSIPEWVTLRGFLKPEQIPSILYDFDVGICPFKLSSYTHAALPLKVIEYGAAQIPCVSSKLKELELQALPWVRFAELNSKSWADEIEKAATSVWDTDWDKLVEHFDWSVGAAKILDLCG